MKNTKIVLKICIIAYTLLRLVQSFLHVMHFYIKTSRILSSSTSYSIVVAVCSLLLFFGVIYEYPVLLQSWMIWTVLQYGLMAFGSFDLGLEANTFIPDSLTVNIIISSIFQILTMIAVVKLTRIIDFHNFMYTLQNQ